MLSSRSEVVAMILSWVQKTIGVPDVYYACICLKNDGTLIAMLLS